jgi:hypothetical protein
MYAQIGKQKPVMHCTPTDWCARKGHRRGLQAAIDQYTAMLEADFEARRPASRQQGGLVRRSLDGPRKAQGATTPCGDHRGRSRAAGGD